MYHAGCVRLTLADANVELSNKTVNFSELMKSLCITHVFVLFNATRVLQNYVSLYDCRQS